jgi:hypothetical protein
LVPDNLASVMLDSRKRAIVAGIDRQRSSRTRARIAPLVLLCEHPAAIADGRTVIAELQRLLKLSAACAKSPCALGHPEIVISLRQIGAQLDHF